MHIVAYLCHVTIKRHKQLSWHALPLDPKLKQRQTVAISNDTLKVIHLEHRSVAYMFKAGDGHTTSKIMNSTALQFRYFGTHCQGFAAASVTWSAYGDNRKREYCSDWKYLIIVASTCRRSVQFGCYISWLWMPNCAFVKTQMLPLYNVTIPCRGRRAWKTIHCAHAFAGSRFWLVESTLFGDDVSLRLHWECILKVNLFN